MELDVSTKADFLYRVFQDWQDGSDYQDEPINSIIQNADVARALCLLHTIELLDVNSSSDYVWVIDRIYDIITELLEVKA